MVMGQTNNFYACSQGNNTYCTNGQCYVPSAIKPQGVSCSTSFTKDAANTIYPVTNDYKSKAVVISEIDTFNI